MKSKLVTSMTVGVVMMAVAFVAGGCTSSKPVDFPSPTIGTAPPVTEPPPPVAPTVPTTAALTTAALTTPEVRTTEVAPTTRLAVPGEGTQYIGVAEAALAAHDEYQRQFLLTSNQWDFEALRKFMTASYAADQLAHLRDVLTTNRRFERRKIDQRIVLRVEGVGGERNKATAILCWRNDNAEFDTKGTLDRSDDVLVQADLGTVAFGSEMALEEGKWLQSGTYDLEEAACSGASWPPAS
jgi:hypothetical protein